MKLSYYGYSLECHDDHLYKLHYLFDLRPFLSAFATLQNAEFKNQFTYGGEHIFFLPYTEHLYLFLMTRTNEIIKKIKASDLSVSEIYEMLETDEHLGFASYVYIGPSFMGFASTIMAPKIKTFGIFLRELLEAIGLAQYHVVLHPLLKQSTRADALDMEFMGRSVVQVTKQNAFYEDIVNFFKGTSEEFSDVDSFEVTFKPKKNKNIEPAIKKVIVELPEDGLDKMIIRAREDIGSSLMDVYLVGKGHVSDHIAKNKEKTITDQIIDKIKSNSVLAEKIKEHESNGEFEKKEPSIFTDLHHVDSWTSRLSNL